MVKDFPISGLAEGQDEYVDLKPGTTTDLYTDTIELFRESTGQKLTAQGDVLKAGRNNDCAIVIEHPHASRHHATFFFESGEWYIRDEKSTNKTYLNGIAIEPSKKYKLYVGDVLSFGPEKYCFFKSRMIPPTPKPAGNFDEAALAILEASIKTFVDSGFNDDTAFKLIITSLSDAPLYVPVQIDVAAMLGNLDPTKLKPGDVISPQKDVRVKVLTLSLEGGGEIVPLFTSTEEVNKGQSVSTMRYYPNDYLPILLKMEKHVVINPFGDHKFILTFEMIKNILKPVIDNKTQNPLTVPPVPVSMPVEPPVKVEKKGVPIPSNKKHDSESFIGKLIDGKYCILREVGRGGASVVYLGIDERANRQLAIKVIDQRAPHVRNIKKFLLGFRNFTPSGMLENALAVFSGFRCTDRPGNFRLEYPDVISNRRAQRGNNVTGVVSSTVHHGEQYSINAEFWIDLLAHSGNRTKQKIQSLRGQKLRLQGDDDAIRCCEGVNVHKTQRRHTVNENEVVTISETIENIPKYKFPAHGIDQAEFYTG